MELIGGAIISLAIGWFFYWLPKKEAQKKLEEEEQKRLEEDKQRPLDPPIETSSIPDPAPIWPLHDNLPAAPRTIVGRDEEIAALHALIEDSKQVAVNGRAIANAVKGPGGIGKTELASEYARRAKATYEGVWLVPAESDATLHESLATLGQKLGCQPANTPKQTALDALQAVRDRDAPWLILFDNATDQQSIAPYLVAGEKLQCLITSRHATWQGIADFAVDTLDEDEALDLLRQVSGREETDFALLLEKLDGYPLALVAAGGYFFERKNATVDQYLAEFDKRLKDDVADGSYKPNEEGSAPPSVYGSVSLSIEALDRDAKGLLSLAAYLSPDDLWLEMIENGSKRNDSIGAHEWPDFVKRIAENPARLAEAVAALERASLLKREGQGNDTRLTLHRLTLAVMRARLRNNGDRWADAAARIVNAFAPHGFAEPAQWNRYARLVPQAEALLPHAPPSQASDRAFSQIGSYLHARGDYPGAIRFLERAMEISVAINGMDSTLHALHLNNLASSFKKNGDLDRAETLCIEAIAIDEAVLGDHPQTATHINNLADLYVRQKAFGEAEPLFQRAERIDRKVLGEDHPNHAIRLSNLGALYDDWSEYLGGDAEKRSLAATYKTDALAATRRALGEVHPETARNLNNLAIFHHRNGDPAAAIPAMRQAIAIRLDLLGPDHPHTRSALNSFAAMVAARDGDASGVQAELEKLPQETAAIRRAHVKWGIGKLAEIAARYEGVEATDLHALADAVQAESERLRAEDAPDEKWSWPVTEFQGAEFALQQAQEWGIGGEEENG